MAKSEHGVSATSTGTVMQISRKEYELRWDRATGKITLEEFNRRLREIRNGK